MGFSPAPGRDFRSGNRTLFAKARAGKMSQVSSSMSADCGSELIKLAW